MRAWIQVADWLGRIFTILNQQVKRYLDETDFIGRTGRR
jgi:hypothetical protein